MTAASRRPSVDTFEGDLPEQLTGAFIAAGQIALDTETSGLDWVDDNLQLIQIASPNSPHVAILRPTEETPQRLLNLLTSSAVEKVFHHACFDLRFMRQRWHFEIRRIVCTKVMSKVLRPNADEGAHTLQSLLRQYCGINIDKSLQQSDWGAGTLTDDQLRYAAQDVRHLFELRDRLQDEVEAKQLDHLVQASLIYLPSRVLLDLAGAGDVFTH